MYQVQIPLALLAALAGFAACYALVSYLRHRQLPTLGQMALALLLCFCLIGLAGAGAGFYMLWAMHAMSPLTLLLVALPTVILAALTVIALTYMRNERSRNAKPTLQNSL